MQIAFERSANRTWRANVVDVGDVPNDVVTMDSIVADEINQDGGSAIAIDGDVTQDEALVNLVDKTVEKFGAINVLVNNVGGGGEQTLDM